MHALVVLHLCGNRKTTLVCSIWVWSFFCVLSSLEGGDRMRQRDGARLDWEGQLRNFKQQMPVQRPEEGSDTKWKKLLPEGEGGGRAAAEL